MSPAFPFSHGGIALLTLAWPPGIPGEHPATASWCIDLRARLRYRRHAQQFSLLSSSCGTRRSSLLIIRAPPAESPPLARIPLPGGWLRARVINKDDGPASKRWLNLRDVLDAEVRNEPYSSDALELPLAASLQDAHADTDNEPIYATGMAGETGGCHCRGIHDMYKTAAHPIC
jgi:hypothetical protein